jgi:ADP-ribosyl-[dinitrogen reductase] hydrolase
MAVNLGEDADTTGAVYGQLAGAFYGVSAIPAAWRARLHRGDAILELATSVVETGEAISAASSLSAPVC